MAEIKGLDELLSKLNNLSGNLEGVLKDAMNKTCTGIVADSKKLTPVLTGNLRRSLTYEVETSGDKVEGRVGSNIEYASKVEFGSSESWEGSYKVKAGSRKKTVKKTFSRKVAKPYLYPAFEMNKNKLEENVKKFAKAKIKELS